MSFVGIRVAKASFFDRDNVLRAMDSANRRALSKAGAYVRQAARTSIRPRKAASPPGSPPSSHVGTLRKLILFGYDPRTKSVVVGPVLFRAASDVPTALEYGGTYPRRRRGKAYAARYRARPFMRPALEKTLDQIPTFWNYTLGV